MTRPPRHARRSIELRDGALRLVVVSDTHGHPHPDSVVRITNEKPDHIVHAGDIGDLGVLRAFEQISPVHCVRGNVDPPTPDIADRLTLELAHGNRRVFACLVAHIALNGTRLHPEVAKLARGENASLVICGHSHVPFIGTDRGLTVFNPGSVGPRRFGLPIVFGVMDFAVTQITLRHVDCETGQTWVP